MYSIKYIYNKELKCREAALHLLQLNFRLFVRYYLFYKKKNAKEVADIISIEDICMTIYFLSKKTFDSLTILVFLSK